MQMFRFIFGRANYCFKYEQSMFNLIKYIFILFSSARKKTKEKNISFFLGSRIFFFNGSAIKEGGKGRAIKEKRIFFDGEVPTAIKLEGGRGDTPPPQLSGQTNWLQI